MNAETLPLLGVVLIGASAAVALIAFLAARRRRSEDKEEAVEEPPTVPAAAEEIPREPAEERAGQVAAPTPERMISVASLLRDEVSGGLVVRVGEREYRSAAELLVSRDRQRIEYTLLELNRWFEGEREKRKGREPRGAAAPEVGRRPLTMVEQINKILDQKLAELPGANRGVRLVEGAGGSVRVYVGVEGYDAIDDVPDAEIRRLIREAVAEWEAAQ